MKKKKTYEIILDIFIYVCIFIFVWYISKYQIIEWTKEIALCESFCILFALKILAYTCGSMFILFKLIQLEYFNKEKKEKWEKTQA